MGLSGLICFFLGLRITQSLSITTTVMARPSTKIPVKKSSDGPVWCEEQQVYLNGVPENAEVTNLIQANQGHLKIFGYGSLCWNPGSDGGLAKATPTLGTVRGYKRVWAQRSTDHRGDIQFPGIVCTLLTKQEYQASIFRRTSVAASASADPSSEGETSCTEDRNNTDCNEDTTSFITQGIIFDIPPALVEETLQDLDFREKGGYSRDVCEVIEAGSQKRHTALLYRGTPDNPAFSSRALVDLPFAAAIMSVAMGPSGPNDVYLNNLYTFLMNTKHNNTVVDDTTTRDDTETLADMVRVFQKQYQLYFLSGGGSNQHNQLFLNRPNIDTLVQAEDAHVRTDIVLPTTTTTSGSISSNTNTIDDGTRKEEESTGIIDLPKEIYAGGGHSALLTTNGRLLLWGWNENQQCGTTTTTTKQISASHNSVSSPTQQDNRHQQQPLPLPFIHELENICVEKAALGFSHTLVIEKQTGTVFAFGNNERGQVSGRCHNRRPQQQGQKPVPLIRGSREDTISVPPMTPEFLINEKIDAVAAGLFHSAVITNTGYLITFGCDRFGQTNLPAVPTDNDDDINNSTGARIALTTYRKWKPDATDRIVDVACGRRHTVAVDSFNQVWTFGENKYGQLGRTSSTTSTKGRKEKVMDPTPVIVDMDGKIGKEDIVHVYCGWSHTIIHVVKNVEKEEESSIIFGFGRNDKGQLGTGSNQHVYHPIELFSEKTIKSVRCGSESTMIIDEKDQIWGCGWNEHGNIGSGDQEDTLTLVPTQGVKTYTPPQLTAAYTTTTMDENTEVALAVGGAHYLVCTVPTPAPSLVGSR